MTNTDYSTLVTKGEKNNGESGLEYSAILTSIPHPLLVIDKNNNIIFGNSAAELFFQTSLNHITNRQLDKILPFGCPILSEIPQIRKNQSSYNAYGVDLSGPKTGDNILCDIYCGPLTDASGHIMLILQQRNMAQMIERQLSYRGAVRTVNGVAAVLAHEIKNPLSGIRGAAQLLETVVGDDDQLLAKLICDESDRILNLVERMEVFGDERPLETEAVNIHDVLGYVKKLAINGFAKNIKFKENYDPSLPKVAGNREQLIQVYLNLVKNAAESVSGQKDGEITFATSYRPGFRLGNPGGEERLLLPLEISIIDNGPGIAEDIKRHLFDPFISSKVNGTGLGLALVAKIIADHGGTIECESYSGQTCFRTMMPLYQEERES